LSWFLRNVNKVKEEKMIWRDKLKKLSKGLNRYKLSISRKLRIFNIWLKVKIMMKT
jgi:hypothetical protein